MQGEIDQYGIEHIQLTSLTDLDRLIADRFALTPVSLQHRPTRRPGTRHLGLGK